LLRPDRSVAASVTSSDAAFDLPVQLLAKGTYTVLVAPGTNTGSISVEVHTAATTEPAAAVIDPVNALSANLAGLFVMDAGDGTVGTEAAAHLFLTGSELAKQGGNSGAGTPGYSWATSQPFRIGSAQFDVAGSLNGRMAYLAVYKGRILTASELSSLDAQLTG